MYQQTLPSRRQDDLGAYFRLLCIVVISSAILVLLSSCGTTMQKLDMVNEETHQVIKQANPIFETLCLDEVQACKKEDRVDSVKVPKTLDKQARLDKLCELCSGFKKCYTAQKTANLTAAGIYMAVQAGAIASLLKNDADLQAALAAALSGLSSLKDILQAAGLFDLLAKLKK